MKRYAHVFLLFFSSSLCFVSLLEAADDPKNQTAIMISLSSFVGRSWNTTKTYFPCSWHGVSCSSSSAVTGISLPGIGPFLSANSSFFVLLGRLDSLRSLNLSSNRLTGDLPNFSAFGALESLDLSYNNFEGRVDSQLELVSGLKRLNLSFNSFNGSIPTRIGRGVVEELVLSHNSFSGQIKDEIFRFGNLTILDLSSNGLSGPVPDGIGRLSKLRTLLLSSNKLTGAIPSNLSEIANLSRFAANQNNFSGTVPAGITRYVNALDLSYNNLTGEIAKDLLSPASLESVDLTVNQLEGNIPRNLSKSLYRLRLGGNLFNGSIPDSIGDLQKLTYLELDGNKLDSEIPSQLGRCKNLTLLNLASNKLHGGLPEELGSLQQLVVVKLQSNNLSGEIPDSLFKLVNLSTLNLSRNSFTGMISAEISGLHMLSNLNLEGNKLMGSIPDSIGELGSLIELELGNNELTGKIPLMPLGLSTALNLSGNQLGGQIPSDLSKLTGLEILDLSNNQLTGQVPGSLVKMQSLTQLVLSNNQLSGVFPHFPPYVNVTVTGNKDLMNATAGSLPTSGSLATPSKKKRYTLLFIVVAIVGALVGFGLLMVILKVLASKHIYQVENVPLRSEENPPQIINGFFLTTNKIHRSSIDFTRAMEAVGNPGNIMLTTRFSTYYKAVMPSGVSYSVKKLNWSDKIFQSGSHGRFGQELEVLGRLSSSNVMVPLAYVLTKDKAYLFYEHVHKGTLFDFLHKGSETDLDWASRYSIALGVAQGLAFLHGCSQPVLLLDLTARSIHLKSQKEPQIGDIELFKVIDPSTSTGNLSTVAGSVGYIPPEYAYTMRVTMAGNVYSFGVILLELLTGKPAVSAGIELAKWATGCSTLDEREQILDTRICRTSVAVQSQMLSVLKVALECVSFSPGERPKMRNVLRMLFNSR